MPDRIVRTGILTSDRVDKLDSESEVFYRRLIGVVDDFGRYDARPTILIAHCFPLRIDRITQDRVKNWLSSCVKAGLIVVYEVDGHAFLELFNLGDRRRAKYSKYPAPPTHAGKRRHVPTGGEKVEDSLVSSTYGDDVSHLSADAGHLTTYATDADAHSDADAHAESNTNSVVEGDIFQKLEGWEISSIPKQIDTPEMRTLLAEYVLYLREKTGKVIPTQWRKQLQHMADIGAGKAREAIDFTIRQGYNGLIEPSGKNGSDKPTKKFVDGNLTVKF